MHTERDITVVEWASIWREVWPEKYIHVQIETLDDGKRRIMIEDSQGMCPKLRQALERWAVEPAAA
jgi:tRNA A37 threonylcarbamoyladenosine biosynthesis protein TsaE